MNRYDFGTFPFVYAPQREPSNGNLPDFLPFSLEVDEITGLIIQSSNQDVSAALSKAYKKSSMISGMMDDTGIGKQYAEDFFAYIKHASGRDEFTGCRVLDIGCGTGYLLRLLQETGAEVVGLEPGIHGQEGAVRYGVPVIRDFFPSDKIKGKFDLIISFGLLEHIREYKEFFGHLLKQMADDGLLISAVPDCDPYFRSGDISFLFHEHWSYFTANSLDTTLHHYSGLNSVVHKAKFGGTIYSTSRKDSASVAGFCAGPQGGTELFDSFIAKSKVAADNIFFFLQQAEQKRQDVGIFVPGRAVNILSTLKEKLGCSRMRFFDDNQMLQGTYFPGFPIAVESRQALLVNPPDKLLVMSHTFGNQIASELKKNGLKSEIMTWLDFFSSDD